MILAVAFVLPSCGDDDGGKTGDDPSDGGGGKTSPQGGASAGAGKSASGSGGTGGVMALPDVPCGDEVCKPRTLPGYPGVAACCADEATSQCGLDTSLLSSFGAEPTRSCEPLAQAGEVDEDCPSSPPFKQGNIELPPFEGCCNAATGTCGYMIDRVLGAIPIGLGCVDATPFLDGATPLPCEPLGGGGSGGAGGVESGGAGGSAG